MKKYPDNCWLDFLSRHLGFLPLYNLNTEAETLIPSLKAIRYNKMQHEGSAIRIDSKEF